MKCATRQVCYLVFGVTVLSLLNISPVAAGEPTLARLAFWVPPDRMEAFGQAYVERLVPLLRQRGLVESDEGGRATADGVFSRLFALHSPLEIELWREALRSESALRSALRDLEDVLAPDSLRYRLDLYRGRAIPGKIARAGPGTRNGLWHTLRVPDRFPAGQVFASLQDGEGKIWFASTGNGLLRFDGDQFAQFKAADGLAGDSAFDLLQDRDGHMWIGTSGGVSRFDGTHFATYSTSDGLIDDDVHAVFQDGEGHLWFGSYTSGVSRFDGKTFVSYSVEHGLPAGGARAILQDREGILWFAGSGTASRFNGRAFESFELTDRLLAWEHSDIYQDRQGTLWFGTGNEGVHRYQDGAWSNFTTADGLADNEVTSIIEDEYGHMWFGTWSGGINRYDGARWTSFTSADGLVDDTPINVLEDRDGHFWWGHAGGISRYDGFTMAHFGPWNGFPSNFFFDVLEDHGGNIWYASYSGVGRVEDGGSVLLLGGSRGQRADSIFEDRSGNLWFGFGDGVKRYAGGRFVSYPDSLLSGFVFHILEDRAGHMWFTAPWKNSGVQRYDGETAITFDTKDGLANNRVHSMAEGRDGRIWFATETGLSRYDGDVFTTSAAANGLAVTDPRSVFSDREGRLWIGSATGTVTRYDRERFETFSDEIGLPPGTIYEIMQDHRGHLWFSNYGAGISHYDGLVFQNISVHDGLVANTVHAAIEDDQGHIWIASDGALTRYRPSSTPPGIRIVELITDRPHGAVSVLELPASQNFLRIEFRGHSLHTPAGRLAYVYRLGDMDADWQVTRETYLSYDDLPLGEYLFEVKAVDRDLNYSEAVQVRIEVQPDYGQAILWSSLGLALLGLIFASGVAIRRRRALLHEQQTRLQVQEQLNRELEEELQTAHELQMGLMPSGSPQIPSFDLAGRCLPANHVGGDFFQYFEKDGRLALCMADVTGHAMDAAVPVMMFSGVLETEMRLANPLNELFEHLNQTLHSKLDSRTYVCFTMGEFDLSLRTLHLSNSGCPYPYHFRKATATVTELQIDAYPLGVRADTVYSTIEVQLEPGDRIIFCSDGIAEAANGQEEIFGFERTAETIRQGCAEGLPAEALIDHLIGAVQDFAGNAPQGDDMTVVVLRVEA